MHSLLQFVECMALTLDYRRTPHVDTRIAAVPNYSLQPVCAFRRNGPTPRNVEPAGPACVELAHSEAGRQGRQTPRWLRQCALRSFRWSGFGHCDVPARCHQDPPASARLVPPTTVCRTDTRCIQRSHRHRASDMGRGRYPRTIQRTRADAAWVHPDMGRLHEHIRVHQELPLSSDGLVLLLGVHVALLTSSDPQRINGSHAPSPPSPLADARLWSQTRYGSSRRD
jgi:hypothetical protein